MPTEDQQAHFTMQFESDEIQVPEAALLRPQAVPIHSFQGLETRRSSKAEPYTGQNSPETAHAQQTPDLQRHSGSFGSDGTDHGIGNDRQIHTPHSEISSPELDSAWERVSHTSGRYRHILTDEIFWGFVPESSTAAGSISR